MNNSNNSTNTNTTTNTNRDRDARSSTGTEYKLSINSNSGSRRSSLAGTGNDIYLNNGETNNNNYKNNTFSNGRLSIGGSDQDSNTFNILHRYLGPQISDLHDSVITLESNLDRLNNIHNNLVDLNESFGSLVYGLICSSSCLQFPGLSNNIKEQMRVFERLNQLETEKDNLLKQIKETKSSMIENSNLTNNHNNGKNSNNNNFKLNQNFSKPLFTVGESRKMKATMNKNISSLPKNRNRNHSSNNGSANDDYNIHKEDDYDDGDDTSSEASFVVNPSNSQQEYLRNGNMDDVDRRYRRKSILNVIRNSVGYSNAPESNLLNGKTSISNERGANTISNRYSLGGRARRVTHGSTLLSASNPITNQQRTKTTVANTVTRRKTVTRRPKSINERPPFR